ncbi:MAG: DUF3310 domain-containing protein [Burkholderiaceae bacterium]|jgi:hypothetical protein|nr:DUF3310 domain-containing protein [Burkholderiaceae bacterium]
MDLREKLIDAIRRNPGITDRELSQIFAIHPSRVIAVLSDQSDLEMTRNSDSARASSESLNGAPHGMLQEEGSDNEKVITPPQAKSAARRNRKGLTKVEMAIAYLQDNGKVDNDAMRRAIGIDKPYHPSQYLSNAVKRGVLKYTGFTWCLGTGTHAAPQAPVTSVLEDVTDDVQPVQPQNMPLRSPYVLPNRQHRPIDILRTQLSPEEFKAFLKGNILKHLIRAERKGGIEDYRKAVVYAGWLVDFVKDRLNDQHGLDKA